MIRRDNEIDFIAAHVAQSELLLGNGGSSALKNFALAKINVVNIVMLSR